MKIMKKIYGNLKLNEMLKNNYVIISFNSHPRKTNKFVFMVRTRYLFKINILGV